MQVFSRVCVLAYLGVGMLNHMPDENGGKRIGGGRKGRHLSPRLVQKVVEGKSFHGLSRKGQMMTLKSRKENTRYETRRL